MKTIRNNFNKKIKQTATDATSILTITYFGAAYFEQEIAQKHYHARLHLKEVEYSPTAKQIKTVLHERSNIISELFLSEIIQHWFDFLGDIYSRAIKDSLSGRHSYPLPKTKLDIDLTLSGQSLTRSIEDTANRKFNFLPAPEKLQIIKKIMNVDLKEVSNDELRIRENIQIRNILQHQLGIVSKKDLSDLGVKHLVENHNDTQKKISDGQRINRTIYDIQDLVDSLISVANTLIP